MVRGGAGAVGTASEGPRALPWFADFWGANYLPQLKDMLCTVCRDRTVPDCEFFINKRDFPHLKADLTEPYDFVYPPSMPVPPLTRERYASYAPIVSFFVSEIAPADGAAPTFADLAFPNTDDWETATGRVYPGGKDIRSSDKRMVRAGPAWWKSRRAVTMLFCVCVCMCVYACVCVCIRVSGAGMQLGGKEENGAFPRQRDGRWHDDRGQPAADAGASVGAVV